MKAFKVKINDKQYVVSGIDSEEVVNCINIVHSRKDNKDIDILLSVHGSSFHGEEQHSSDWCEPMYELKVNDKVEIEVLEVDSVDEPTSKDTVHKSAGKRCTFCVKSNEEVDYLFEKRPGLIICSDCVESCAKDIDRRRNKTKISE